MPYENFSRSDRLNIFQLAIEAFFDWSFGASEPVIQYDGLSLSMSDACCLVLGRSEIVPSGWDDIAVELDARDRTYGACAEALHQYLNKA